ncbi:ABC transporter substrate-binding protein [Bauldia sp.]|uniref:ABC transporter substrate-binding protein n=1 Tax=Bauldia sp. TaxID=2575872 RepID=UPI003BA98D2A
MRTSLSKLSITGIATAALATALTAGAAVAEDPISLTVWSDTPRLTYFEAYDKANEDIDLTVVTVAPADLVAKLQLSMRAGSDIPDVIFMSSIAYGAQLSTRRSNYLMDLTDKVPQPLLDEFYTNANSPCIINDRLLCLRNDLAHMLIWYDAPKMEELGKQIPTTWEEFEQLGAELAAMDDDYLLGSAVEPWPLYAFLMAGGCEMGVPVAGKDDTVHIDLTTENCLRPARMVDAMAANGSLSRFGPFDPNFVNQAKEGKVPLIVGPTWFGEYVMRPTYEVPEGRLAAALPLKWESQEQPLAWSWGGGTFGGWKDTEHPEAVVDLIIWSAVDIDNRAIEATLPGHEPSALAWGKRLRSDEYYANHQVLDALVDSAAFSHPDYVSQRFSVPDAIGKVVAPELANGAKLVDLLPALQEELINVARLNGYIVE